jgi:hypothetical protein
MTFVDKDRLIGGLNGDGANSNRRGLRATCRRGRARRSHRATSHPMLVAPQKVSRLTIQYGTQAAEHGEVQPLGSVAYQPRDLRLRRCAILTEGRGKVPV